MCVKILAQPRDIVSANLADLALLLHNGTAHPTPLRCDNAWNMPSNGALPSRSKMHKTKLSSALTA